MFSDYIITDHKKQNKKKTQLNQLHQAQEK